VLLSLLLLLLLLPLLLLEEWGCCLRAGPGAAMLRASCSTGGLAACWGRQESRRLLEKQS